MKMQDSGTVGDRNTKAQAADRLLCVNVESPLSVLALVQNRHPHNTTAMLCRLRST